MKIASHGHTLRSFVHPGEPGDVLIVLDDQGNELGRGVSVPTGNVVVHFDRPIQLPARDGSYEVHRVPAALREPRYIVTMDASELDSG